MNMYANHECDRYYMLTKSMEDKSQYTCRVCKSTIQLSDEQWIDMQLSNARKKRVTRKLVSEPR
jgi:hypothetical protein